MMATFWLSIVFLSMVSITTAASPVNEKNYSGELGQHENNTLHQKPPQLQQFVLTLIEQVKATQRQLNITQERLEFTQRQLDEQLRKSQTYGISLSDQVKQNSKKIKALNPNCNLQASNVCGNCECRDDERLENKYYCNCLNLPPRRDCLAHLENGGTINGVYHINPNYQSLNVFCDQQDSGGGWTVIQRRMDGSVNFYRNWDEYARGFGSLQHEFWLGNDRIFLMSVQALYPKGSQLQVDMEDFNRETRFARYENFQVGNAFSNYQLLVGGYSGNAGDSLSYHNRMMFSTYDKDNDKCPDQCARNDKPYNQGAWWYNCCANCNLNAEKYHIAEKQIFCEGIFWDKFTSGCGGRTLKYTLMKMRRK